MFDCVESTLKKKGIGLLKPIAALDLPVGWRHFCKKNCGTFLSGGGETASEEEKEMRMIQESFLVHPHTPFRLDLTVWTLRRRATNRIDQQITLDVGMLLLNRLAETYGIKFADDQTVCSAFPRPEEVATASIESLRTLGFSRQKARAMLELATALVQEQQDLSLLEGMNNEASLSLPLLFFLNFVARGHFSHFTQRRDDRAIAGFGKLDRPLHGKRIDVDASHAVEHLDLGVDLRVLLRPAPLHCYGEAADLLAFLAQDRDHVHSRAAGQSQEQQAVGLGPSARSTRILLRIKVKVKAVNSSDKVHAFCQGD